MLERNIQTWKQKVNVLCKHSFALCVISSSKWARRPCQLAWGEIFRNQNKMSSKRSEKHKMKNKEKMKQKDEESLDDGLTEQEKNAER